ncbi:S66 peptidase family protein, partial [Bordetella bronchiseptica]|uniref:S66 peptidase family protein n=5 Tax=Bordetella bronchiseptica TaxID=518 RepID=UPI0005287E49
SAAQPVPALRAGARIAIVAPASAITGAADEAAEWLLERGYEPQVMPAARMRLAPPFDYLAGDDAARLADLHAAFADPAVGAVWCLQGGFGSWRVLDQIDYGLLRRHAKPFIGYSDVTALHLAIQRYAGFVTFHGPMLAQDLLAGRQAPTEQALLDMVSGRLGAGSWIVAPPQARLATLASGVATGRLIGGNLALLAALTGTRYAIDARDGILFFEDVNEALPRVDRMLAQLRRAGAFDGVRGVLVGSFTRLLGVPGDGEAAQAALYPLVREHFQARGIPVLAGWPSGHGDPNLTLPLGARVTLDAGRGALRLEQPVAV